MDVSHVWHRGLLLLLLLAPDALRSASLTWTGAQSSEWNTVHENWLGGATFQTGDHVAFANGGPIFIGLDGIPQPVSPAARPPLFGNRPTGIAP